MLINSLNALWSILCVYILKNYGPKPGSIIMGIIFSTVTILLAVILYGLLSLLFAIMNTLVGHIILVGLLACAATYSIGMFNYQIASEVNQNDDT